jgi:hypothetical protein
MSVANISKNPVSKEQIKKESVKVLSESVVKSKSKIKKLQDLKIKTEQVVKQLTATNNLFVNQNNRLKESLLKELNLQVTK